MTKKAIISILFLLLLTTLACTSADYAAAFHVEYEGEELPSSSSSTLSAEEQSEATMLTAGVPSTALPAMRVCTGAKKGTLRVRDNAGTDQAVIAYLTEGVSVEILDEKISESGTWTKIKSPEGWVNKRYLCEKE